MDFLVALIVAIVSVAVGYAAFRWRAAPKCECNYKIEEKWGIKADGSDENQGFNAKIDESQVSEAVTEYNQISEQMILMPSRRLYNINDVVSTLNEYAEHIRDILRWLRKYNPHGVNDKCVKCINENLGLLVNKTTEIRNTLEYCKRCNYSVLQTYNEISFTLNDAVNYYSECQIAFELKAGAILRNSF